MATSMSITIHSEAEQTVYRSILCCSAANRYDASQRGSYVRLKREPRGDYMDSNQAVLYVIYAVVAFFALGTILSGFFQVRTAEAVVIQRMGKFLRVANAGMNFKLPWLDQIAGRTDLRVQQLALDVE